MPTERAPEYITPADLASEDYRRAADDYSKQYALATVTQTFWQFEQYRYQNHDRRWNDADALYIGYVPQKVWEGTAISRSSLAMPIVFDQVEAALPTISQAIFGVGPDWFDVEAGPGVDPKEARAKKDAISYVLEHPKDDVGSNSRAEIELAIRNILLYGNGGVLVEWDGLLERPKISWIDIRDFYIDPGLTVPNVEEARAIIRRQFLTVDDLLKLKKDPRMNIPDVEVLNYMAKTAPTAPADQTKRVHESLRGVQYSPGSSDWLPLPSAQRVEVLIYYSHDKIIWVLNREWVAFNGPNPYGFYPVSFAPCYIVPGRFYAMSFADAQEGNQRYMEALFNAHLDELSLALHPPRIMPRSSGLTPAQERWAPGVVMKADDPKQVGLLQPQPATANVFTEIEFIQQMAEKRTGVNGMGQGSIPQPSNANRTAAGLSMQMSGATGRMMHLVSNLEQYLLVPVLYKLERLLQLHSRPGSILPARSSKGVYGVTSGVMSRPSRFRISAASRMMTRDKLMQVFPVIMQYVLQGAFVQQLHQVGKTIDFEELFQMLQDAAGIGRSYGLVRPLNDQEKQSMQQPSPDAQAQAQAKQQDSQDKKDLMQMKVQGDLQKAQIMKQPDAGAMQAQQQQAQIQQQQAQQELMMEAAARQQEMQHQMAMNKIKVEGERDKRQMDLQAKQAQIGVQMQKAQGDMQIAHATNQQKMAQMYEQMKMDRMNAANQADIAQKYPAPTMQRAPAADDTASTQTSGRAGTQPRKHNEVKKKERAPKG